MPKLDIVLDSLYCGNGSKNSKLSSITLTLNRQCPMLNSSELLPNTKTCLSFKLIDPLFFSHRVHSNTERRTDQR